jgi:hypothetical protein
MQDVSGTAFAEVKLCPWPGGIAASGLLSKAGDLDLAYLPWSHVGFGAPRGNRTPNPLSECQALLDVDCY